MDQASALNSDGRPASALLSPVWCGTLAAAVVLTWIIFQLGWTTAHVFNATRFLLYDQGSYLYAVGRWQAGEALYRDFAWQYGPLALGWYRAFASVGGNTPLTLVVASSFAFAIAWVIVARLVIRVSGGAWGSALAIICLLPIMSASGVNAINGPHGAIEMLLLSAIAWTLSRPQTARSFSPWVLGGLVGLLQWVRFGPHVIALGGILLIAAWQRWPRVGENRNFVRAMGRYAVRVLAGYALGVAPLAVWFFHALPAEGAGEMLWPAHMVAHYAATYPNRWPQVSSIEEWATVWLPALLGAGLALVILLGRVWPGRDKIEPPAESAVAGVIFLPLYYVLGCVGLFHNDYAIGGHLWLAWPGLALGALLVRGWMRAMVAVAVAPAVLAMVVAIGTTVRDERSWQAQPMMLPNGQSLWFRPSEAQRFGELREALGLKPSTRRLAVFLGGGGIHYFFGTQRVGRHWWFLPEFVRPWETTAVWEALLRHDLILVVDMGQQPTAPLESGVVPLWIPLPKTMTDALLPHLKNPRHIAGVGDLVQVEP